MHGLGAVTSYCIRWMWKMFRIPSKGDGNDIEDYIVVTECELIALLDDSMQIVG